MAPKARIRMRASSMIEIVLSISVGLGLAIGSIVLLQTTMRKAVVSDLLSASTLVQSRFSQLVNSNRHFPEGDVTPKFAADGLPGITTHSDRTMSHKWARSVTIEQEGTDTLQIMFNGMSQKHCKIFMVNAVGFPQVSGVYTTARIDLKTHPLSRADGAAHCKYDDVDVGFVFSSTLPNILKEPDIAVASSEEEGEAASEGLESSRADADHQAGPGSYQTSKTSRGNRYSTKGSQPSEFERPNLTAAGSIFNLSGAAMPNTASEGILWEAKITSNLLGGDREFPIKPGAEISIYGDGAPTFREPGGADLKEGKMPTQGITITMETPPCGESHTVILDEKDGKRGYWLVRGLSPVA
ncbi:MAG: hypothetical protein ABJN42_19940 [Roseibium sp.]|uniref:hypothetical protein n=1 Tax=Roseibium sp. TaxID=1936156 RepID=UPI003296DC44